jgi:hypothetical protein
MSSARSQEILMSDVPTGRQRPNFLQFLGRFENGELVEKLTRELEEIVAAMEQVDQDHGLRNSKGSLTIDIRLARKKDVYEIAIDSKVKKPKGPASGEIMWANEVNSLVPENPKQQKLPFREVVRPRGSDPHGDGLDA